MAKKQAQSASSLLKFRRRASLEKTATGNEEQTKLPYVTTDTSVGHVFIMIALSVCRAITGLSLRRRFMVYFGFIVIGGILADFTPILIKAFVPIKTSKDNILNQWFVKLGWGWTLALCTPFVILTTQVMNSSYPKDNEPQRRENDEQSPLLSGSQPSSLSDKASKLFYMVVTPDMTRIVVNTMIWYFSTNSFIAVEDYFGSCIGFANKSRVACQKIGGSWDGFDISGHTFILLYSTLSILEEVSVMVGWEPFGHHLNAQQQHFKKQSFGDHKQFVVYSNLLKPIRILFVLLTVLTVIWDFMLIQTALYYHTMIQKAIAAIWAVAAWFLTYRLLYRSEALSSVVKPPRRPVYD
ncbi:Acyl-coenzyme A diphosphatase FITM2 [Halotydeus destructor]|nr:Acyl-coenzyme A diphosphatase FITM2 [Halotydeus destructor]